MILAFQANDPGSNPGGRTKLLVRLVRAPGHHKHGAQWEKPIQSNIELSTSTYHRAHGQSQNICTVPQRTRTHSTGSGQGHPPGGAQLPARVTSRVPQDRGRLFFPPSQASTITSPGKASQRRTRFQPSGRDISQPTRTHGTTTARRGSSSPSRR